VCFLRHRRSFWIERPHLIQALCNVGFSSVSEQFDWLVDNVTDDFIQQNDRGLFMVYKGARLVERNTAS
jgi:hypothetical protein